MTITIKDTKLSSLYKTMEKNSTTLDDSNLVQVLAAVADGSKLSFAKAVTELLQAGHHPPAAAGARQGRPVGHREEGPGDHPRQGRGAARSGGEELPRGRRRPRPARR
ncbi:MAG: hypothetical protein QM765_01870 [Myxococcales bacterium]